MKKLFSAGAVALFVLALSGEALAQNYSSSPNSGGTRLSRCMRQALIGAGVGAAVGLLTAPRGNRTENAALGGIAGGLGTYGVCRWLSSRERARVENNYYSSLSGNRAVNDRWTAENGEPRSLTVTQPRRAEGYGSNCRTVNGTVTSGSHGQQALPPEVFCRNSAGQWVPAG